MDRTIVLNLHPTPEQAAKLKETLTEYSQCFNDVACEGGLPRSAIANQLCGVVGCGN